MVNYFLIVEVQEYVSNTIMVNTYVNLQIDVKCNIKYKLITICNGVKQGEYYRMCRLVFILY